MANTKQKKQNKGQKTSRAQAEARLAAAKEAEERAAAAKEKKERGKKILTVVVCVILVLALGIPTVALSFLTA